MKTKTAVLNVKPCVRFAEEKVASEKSERGSLLCIKKLLMLMVLAPLMALADTWTDPDTEIEWYYTVSGGNAQVGSGPSRGTTGAVTIPSTLGGYPVTSIGRSAFYNCRKLTSVTIPSSVTSIGDDAFYGCSGLTSVTIPSSVTSIGRRAFYNCSGLTSVAIPSSVTSIGDDAFNGCSGISTIIVDYGETFHIRMILSGSGLPALPPYEAFVEKKPDGGPYKETVDGVEWIFSVSNGESQVGSGSSSSPAIPKATTGAVTIPSKLGYCSVTSVGDYAFYNCSGLTSVTIPSSVTSIGGRVFYDCNSLMLISVDEGNASYCSVDGVLYSKAKTELICHPAGKRGDMMISEGVTSIWEWAFYNCSGLKSVTIPSSVTSIGESAFRDCSELTSVTIPEGVTSIGKETFYGCSGLTSVTIPSGITSIGMDAFRNCSGLKSVTIPSSVTGIGISAFCGCSGLASVTIPSSVTNIGRATFGGCIGLTSVTILEGVARIGESSFEDCIGLTLVTIPSSVTSIGMDAFRNCSGLKSVTIPSSVTGIGISAFCGCSGLTSVTISEGVTIIGEGAFAWCSGLTSVTIPSSVTSIVRRAFEGCSGLVSFVVDAANPNYSSTNGLLCSKDGKTLIAGVNGNVTIPEGVTSISDTAFEGYVGLTSVTIPSSVTSIGNYAFYGCIGLTSVTIPSSVMSIGDRVFEYCSGLTSVTIPEGVTSIGEEAFYGCTNLTSVTIPSSVTSIGNYAFQNCSGLTSVTISEGVASIGKWAFNGCSGIETVTIPACVTHLSDAFPSAYSKIREVVICDGVTSIGKDAFWNCSGLTSVTIPSSVTSIGIRAFSDCSGLDSIFYKGNAPSIDESCFSGVSSSCTAYVRRGSTGWGVDIPGKWNGINIAYATPIDAGGGVTVNVPDSWMEPYGGYTKVNDIGANGLPYWQSYVLGLDPTDETSKVEFAAPKDDDPDKIELGLNIKVPAGAGVTPMYVLMKDGVKVADELVIDLSGEGDPTGLYTVSVKIGTSEIPVEQTIGVQKGESTMTKTAISVPWGRLNGGGPVSVADLVKTANLTVGDKLHIYNKSAKRYETWELDADKVWQPLATYLINADGSVSTVSAGKPTDTTVKRGSAVWLERQDPTKPFYLYGGYEAGEIETEIEAGSAAEPSWNLIAAPSIEPFDLNRIEGADAKDQIMVTTETGPVVYTFKNGAWGCDVNKTEKRKGPGGVEIEVVKRVRDTEHTTIPAGVGFWYVSQGGKPTIKW